MKKSRLLSLICPLTALIAEITPYGAVLNFWNPEGESYRQSYSYFDPTPFGYANFSPLITAVLTCIILIMTAVFIAKPKKTAAKTIAAVSAATFVISLSPLFFGISFFSLTGAVISISLLINSIVHFISYHRMQ